MAEPAIPVFSFCCLVSCVLLVSRARSVPFVETVLDAFQMPYVAAMMLSFGLLVMAAILGSPLTGTAACIVMLGAFVWRFNQSCTESLWPAWALSVFLLKLPLKLDELLVHRLQLLSCALVVAFSTC